jgi:hypothetical protein
MLKKLAIIFLAMFFVVPSVFAGNIPEFDTVGHDHLNVFNDAVTDCVVLNNVINSQSNWWWNYPLAGPIEFDPITGEVVEDTLPLGEDGKAQEAFYTNAADPESDPCFNTCIGLEDYDSCKIGPWPGDELIYQWLIVLQMMPETDLDLVIRDCVLKENQDNIWFYAQQTGRYRQTNGKLVFKRNMNPRVTVTAINGPKHKFRPFKIDARKMPNLGLTCLNKSLYTSKALWEEVIVMKMPVRQGANGDGEVESVLREGDMLLVQVDIPWNNPVDIWYGPDNVVIEYVGIINMKMVQPEVILDEDDWNDDGVL